MNLIIILLIPLLGTTIGSCCVFFMKEQLSENIKRFLLAFASGVMIAASIWSLLLPSIEMSSKMKHFSWVPAASGLFLGILFLLILDNIIPSLNTKVVSSKFKKTTMMVMAITLHNIPEGMAVGVAAAGVLYGKVGITMAGALALSIGIGIQNFPEGAIISMPLKTTGYSKLKSFKYGVLSGVVEPVAGVITLLLTNFITNILPYLLSFAAGAMIYVVIEELIPQSHTDKEKNYVPLIFAFGFILMMVLDVALS